MPGSWWILPFRQVQLEYQPEELNSGFILYHYHDRMQSEIGRPLFQFPVHFLQLS